MLIICLAFGTRVRKRGPYLALTGATGASLELSPVLPQGVLGLHQAVSVRDSAVWMGLDIMIPHAIVVQVPTRAILPRGGTPRASHGSYVVTPCRDGVPAVVARGEPTVRPRRALALQLAPLLVGALALAPRPPIPPAVELAQDLPSHPIGTGNPHPLAPGFLRSLCPSAAEWCCNTGGLG